MNLSLSLLRLTGSTNDTKLSHSFSLCPPLNPVWKKYSAGLN
jgi:hypothetical protein